MFGDVLNNDRNWDTKQLSEFGTLKNGINFNSSKEGIKIKCLGVGDFKNYSVIENINNLSDVYLKAQPNEDYLLKNGDIVFVRSNGNRNLVGRSVTIYPNDIPVTFSGFCIRLRLNKNFITTTYILSVFKSESIKKLLVGKGSNIQNLNQQILSKLTIPNPPIELQNKFAKFVELTDKLKFYDLFKVFSVRYFNIYIIYHSIFKRCVYFCMT